MASRTARDDRGGMHGRRIRVALIVGLGIWVFIAGRLAMIQLVHGPRLAGCARRQQFAEVVLAADRGTIYDRNMVPLTDNLTVSSVCAYPHEVESTKNVAHALAKVLGGSYRDYQSKLRQDRNFVWIARQVSPKKAERLAELGLPGIAFLTESKRVYPQGRHGAHVVGLTDVDGNGLCGVELQMDQALTGARETVIHFLDCAGRRTPAPACSKTIPKDGESVVLTIDLGLQSIAEVELERAVREWEAKAGSIVIQDPWTGEILAMASWPVFDPNTPSRYSVESQKNRVVTDQFEPGSTFKIVTASAALETGAAGRTSVYWAGRGKKRVGGALIHDVKERGWLVFDDALVYSSNVCFAEIASAVGDVLLYSYARDFGFGSPTGIALPGEVRGTLREPASWSKRSAQTIGIGQEVAVTALQLVGAYSAIANGGYLMQPQIVKAVLAEDGRVVDEPRLSAVRQVIRPEVAAAVRELLAMTAERGTGKNAQVSEVAVGGKTGTAQKVVPGIRGFAPGKHVSSFAGMVPADDPRFVCLVVIDEPKGRGLGGEVAAPAFSRIVERVVRGPGHEYVITGDDRGFESANGGGAPGGPGVALASTRASGFAVTEIVYASDVGDGHAAASFESSECAEDGATESFADAGTFPGYGEPLTSGTSWTDRVPVELLLPPEPASEVVDMPDLDGMSARLARRTAAELGLLLTLEGSGVVERQSPRAGASVRPGERVVVTCSMR